MKLLIAGLVTLLNINFKILPSFDLLIVMGITIIADLVTGIIKAVMMGKARTSEGYRKTVIKFMQYGGAITVGLLLKFLSAKKSEMADFSQYAGYLSSGLVIFIIFIEVTSILENISAMDNSTVFCKYLITPLLKLLTFQIKNNPIAKMEQKQEEQAQSQNQNTPS